MAGGAARSEGIANYLAYLALAAVLAASAANALTLASSNTAPAGLRILALDVGVWDTVMSASGTPSITERLPNGPYLVAWISAPASNPASGQVKAALISPQNGSVYVVVVDPRHNNVGLGGVAVGSRSFGVVYERFTPSTKLDVYFAIVKPNGEILGPAAVADSPSYEAYARVAYAAGYYLVAWYDSRDKSIYGAIFSERGALIKGRFLIARTDEPYSQAALQVYGFGPHFLVLYRKFDGVQHGVYARVVGLSGSVSKEVKILDNPGINENLKGCLTSTQNPLVKAKLFIPVVGGGNVYLVVLDTLTWRVSKVVTLSTAGINPYLSVIPDLGLVAVAWVDMRNDSLGDINVAFINASSASIIKSVDISRGLQNIREYSPAISYSRGSGGLLVLWGASFGGSQEVLAALVRPGFGNTSLVGPVTLATLQVAGLSIDGLATGPIVTWGSFAAPITIVRSNGDKDLALVEGNVFKDVLSGSLTSPVSRISAIHMKTLAPLVSTVFRTIYSTVTKSFLKYRTVYRNRTVTVVKTTTSLTTSVKTMYKVRTVRTGVEVITAFITKTPRWAYATLGGTAALAAISAALAFLLIRARRGFRGKRR